jgi:hypothetical protein
MKKLTTTMMQQTLSKQDRRLTVGLDLGDRSSFYCVLDEAGDVLIEQRLSTTPKAIKEIFGAMPRSRIALETGTHVVTLYVRRPESLRSPDGWPLRQADIRSKLWMTEELCVRHSSRRT